MPVRVTAADAQRLQRQCGVSPYLQAREIVVKALRPLWGRLDEAHRRKLLAMLEASTEEGPGPAQDERKRPVSKLSTPNRHIRTRKGLDAP